MPINVQCDNCERRMRVGDNLAGKKIKCPQCQTVLTVGPVPSDSAETEPAAPKAPEKSPEPAAPVKTKTETKAKTPAATKTSAPAKSAAPTKSTAPAKAPAKTSTPKPAAAAPQEAPPAPKKKSVESYYVKTEDEEYYGPVPKTDLDGWVTEGRLGEECQLLRDGTDQWVWASDIYPELAKEGSPSDEEESAESEAADDEATVAFTLPKGAAKKSRFVEEEPEPEPEHEEPPEEEQQHEEEEEEEPAPVVIKKSASKGSSKKKPSSRSADDDEEVSDRAQLVAGLLAIFLGATGAHRFYLGYVPQGVIMAVTCGGALVWQIIDIVQILTGKMRDVHGRPLKK